MITCKFNGRLGNNLFQIANVVSVAKKLNSDFIFPHTTWAGHREKIPVDLSMFKYTFPRGYVDLDNEYNEKEFHQNDLSHIINNTMFSGFYQSWKYFEDIKDELLNKYFIPSDDVLRGLMKYNVSSNSLGISVRRGDYLMLQHNHCVLSVSYYQDAINKYFLDNIDEIYVFSDDIEWCQTIFGNDVHYVIDDKGVQLFLMSKMQNLILSNSTFAWWGAYLNQNNGIIVAPDPWFGPAYQHNNTSDLYYKTWKILNHKIITHPFTITPNMYE